MSREERQRQRWPAGAAVEGLGKFWCVAWLAAGASREEDAAEGEGAGFVGVRWKVWSPKEQGLTLWPRVGKFFVF